MKWCQFFLVIVGVLLSMPAVLGAEALGPAEYRFAAGDVIEVTITPQRNFDRTVTVQPDGKISYPLVGQIQAAGLTLKQLTEKLHDELNRQLVEPIVSLSLREAGKRDVGRVSLLGAVRSPGAVEIKEGTTLAEALAAVGGPTRLADLRRVVITRADRSVITADLTQTDSMGRLERNVTLRPNDLITVPEGAPPTVLVLGEVMKPGSYEIAGEVRLVDVISQAGGPTTKADLHRVTLARPGAPGARVVDLHPLLVQGDTSHPELNPRVQPGDTIMIGETDQRIYILGRVAKPDTYSIKPNDRLLDALTEAGGASGDGDISKAVLVRRNEQGQTVAKPVDLKKMMAKGDLAQNELLRPGDLLYVPDKKTRRSPAESLGLIFPITSLLNLFRY